jgi:(2Fe-2S) ferredoxin
MSPFTHHVFVCCNQREPGHRRGCCDCDGSGRLRAVLKAAIAERGLSGQVRANAAGCLDQCELGPVVVIYPQGIWYGGVREEDVPRIVEQTIVQGQVLADLRIPDEALNTTGAHGWRRGGPEDRQG